MTSLWQASRGRLLIPSSLSQLIRPSRTPLAHPVLQVIITRTATSKQKITIAKYGTRQAKAGKKGDFLRNAKQQAKDPKKKKTDEDKGAQRESSLSFSSEKEKRVEKLDEQQIIEALSEANTNKQSLKYNEMFNLPNFTVATQNYEDFEAIRREGEERKTVTEHDLREERSQYIQRLWEPYATKEFNLQKLVGNVPPSSEILNPHEMEAKKRPSKMLYYSEADIQKYLPEGIAGHLNKVFEWPDFNTKGVLMRPVVEDVIKWLVRWQKREFLGRKNEEDFYTLLEGPIGCGKSSLLNPIVHWARLTGWLVLFVPSGADWAGFPKKRQGTDKMLSYSKVNDTWFGQPNLATKWIKALLVAHGDKLEALKLRTDFTVMDVDPDKPTFTSSREKTLKELLEYGLQHPDQASDCVWYLRQEVCAVTEYPVLIVVDDVNTIVGPSKYGDPIDPYVFAPRLPNSRLVLSRAFQDFRHHGLANGMYVGALNASANLKSMKEKQPNIDLIPTRYHYNKNLNIKKVPPLSRSEAHILSDWFHANGVFGSELPQQTVDYMWAMSQGNGKEFWRQAESM